VIGHDDGVDAPDRLIALDGAFNFRDLGGYRGSEGKVTRWGTLFRSDTLHELSPTDVGTLRTMGLATVIDLRTPRELARTGRGPLGPEPIRYQNLSVIREGAGREAEGEAMASPDGDDLSERYLWYLEVGGQALGEALTILGEPANYPLVFHCAAGKDRTGVLAALVLDLLGVEPEVIVDDYLITAGRMELILARYRSDPAFGVRMAQAPPSRFGVEGTTMERFLDVLHQRLGGAEAWASTVGVPPASIERMRSVLLESTG
jgi:rhodanese-related sulfurtransferase